MIHVSTERPATPPDRHALRRHVLRDDVYDALLDMLVSQQLVPGNPLRIDPLARHLGVSPTPVREALVFLEHTGLVARTALKGYTVAPHLSAQQVGELVDARAVVELAAVDLAARTAPAWQDELDAAHRAHREAADALESGPRGTPPPPAAVRRYFEADWTFHLVIVRAAGNPFLSQMLQRLGTHLHRLVQSAGRGVGDWEAALGEHAAVLEALRTGLPEQAVATMRTHLDGVRTRAIADAGARSAEMV